MTNISRRDFTLGMAAAGIMISLPSLSKADNDKPRGGTLNLVAANEYPLLIPIFQNIGVAGVTGRVIEGLLTINFDLSVSPNLCKSWEISPDGKVYTLKLQDNVKWHDGKPFTSRDVEYSLLLIGKTSARRKVTFQYLQKIDSSDPLTVILYFDKPVPFLLNTLTAKGCPMLPRHLYEGTDVRTNPYNRKPIGTGPYVFKEWERGSYHLLERNANYWRPGLPYLDQIIVRYILDPGSRLAAFEGGTLNIGFDSPIPVEELPRFLKANPDFVTVTRGYEEAGAMNQLFFNLRTESLQNVKVREAIAHAIDIPSYINRVWRGYAVPAPTPIPPNQKKFFDAEIKHREFNVATAEKLLDEAGLTKKADGKRLSLRLTYNPFFRELKSGADFIRSALNTIGIDVTVSNYDSATYVREVFTNAAFDIDLNGVDGGFDPTDGVQRVYWSKNRALGIPFSNHTWYANNEVDDLLEKGSIEKDTNIRASYYKKFQEIVNQDLPVINLVSQKYFTLVKRNLHDYTTNGAGPSSSFETTYIK